MILILKKLWHWSIFYEVIRRTKKCAKCFGPPCICRNLTELICDIECSVFNTCCQKIVVLQWKTRRRKKAKKRRKTSRVSRKFIRLIVEFTRVTWLNIVSWSMSARYFVTTLIVIGVTLGFTNYLLINKYYHSLVLLRCLSIIELLTADAL